MSRDYEIGKDIGDIHARLAKLENLRSSACSGGCGCGGGRKRKLTKVEREKIQDWIRLADGYRRMSEGEQVEGLEFPAHLGYTPAQLSCIIGLVLVYCGFCILVCGGPEDLPCIAECCGDSWEEILDTCVT